MSTKKWQLFLRGFKPEKIHQTLPDFSEDVLLEGFFISKKMRQNLIRKYASISKAKRRILKYLIAKQHNNAIYDLEPVRKTRHLNSTEVLKMLMSALRVL